MKITREETRFFFFKLENSKRHNFQNKSRTVLRLPLNKKK